MAKNLTQFPPQRLTERAVIMISGDDALAWLDNLVTCDLSGARDAAYGALLSPQGKILHDMFILPHGEAVLVDCGRSQIDRLIQKLKLYRLRAKLSFERRDDLHVGVSPAPIDGGYTDPRHESLGYRVIGTTLLDEGRGYHAWRAARGFADSDRDIGVDLHFPHEANFDQFGGVSFTKGCYVGQEVVSRMQHRGSARNRMLPVRCAGTGPLMSGETVVGQVLSHEDGQGIALVRLDRLAEAKEKLLVSGEPATLSAPDWIAYDVAVPEILP
jgi:tRNA-modifying protein YgfZ